MTTVLVLTWPEGLTFTEMEAKQNQLEAEHACQVTGGVAMTSHDRIRFINALDHLLAIARSVPGLPLDGGTIRAVENLRAKIRGGLR